MHLAVLWSRCACCIRVVRQSESSKDQLCKQALGFILQKTLFSADASSSSVIAGWAGTLHAILLLADASSSSVVDCRTGVAEQTVQSCYFHTVILFTVVVSVVTLHLSVASSAFMFAGWTGVVETKSSQTPSVSKPYNLLTLYIYYHYHLLLLYLSLLYCVLHLALSCLQVGQEWWRLKLMWSPSEMQQAQMMLAYSTRY